MVEPQGPITYKVRRSQLPAFELAGFTRIVKSGGEFYGDARRDGTWENLTGIAGEDKTVYGVASLDKECPKGYYRYTLAVKADAAELEATSIGGDIFRIGIKESDWLFFAIEHFEAQYGTFWNDNPYELTARLGWAFNSKLGLHIDVFPPSYSADNDFMEFMMPVRKPG